VDRPDLAHTELAEDLLIALTGQLTERGRGRDDRDGRIATSGEAGEAAQDDSIADLVFRTADDDDVSVAHGC
jgi:hypothetical protein